MARFTKHKLATKWLQSRLKIPKENARLVHHKIGEKLTNYVAFNFGGRNIVGFTGKFGLFLSISWFWIEPWVLFYWNESGREQGCYGRSRLDGPSSGPESWRAWNSLTAQDKVSPAHLGIPGRKINTAAETILHPSNIFIMDIVNGGQGGFLDLRF